jgi:hypothetical protein
MELRGIVLRVTSGSPQTVKFIIIQATAIFNNQRPSLTPNLPFVWGPTASHMLLRQRDRSFFILVYKLIRSSPRFRSHETIHSQFSLSGTYDPRKRSDRKFSTETRLFPGGRDQIENFQRRPGFSCHPKFNFVFSVCSVALILSLF